MNISLTLDHINKIRKYNSKIVLIYNEKKTFILTTYSIYSWACACVWTNKKSSEGKCERCVIELQTTFEILNHVMEEQRDTGVKI